MKILIVEDEPSLREVMQRALRQEGYVVETAATYAEADRRVSGYDYDCILLDIMLPDGNGLRLLERIKELRRKENVIIVSARDSLEDKVLGLDRGADDYLAKPFHTAELLARVKSVLRRSRSGGDMTVNAAHCTPPGTAAAHCAMKRPFMFRTAACCGTHCSRHRAFCTLFCGSTPGALGL